MATNPVIRRIPRDKLLAVFKTSEMVKLFEDVLYGVGETLPANTAEASTSAGAAQATADGAQVAANAAQVTADQGVADAASASAAAAVALADAQTRLLAADMTGAVSWFATNAPPANWLECNGGAVSRTTYAALFTRIGTTFGVGDGATTFNLPELRGEFVRGWDNGRGVDAARTFGSAQADELKAHTHTATGSFVADTGATRAATAAGAAWATGGTVAIGSTGGTETRPRNVALLPCIHV